MLEHDQHDHHDHHSRPDRYSPFHLIIYRSLLIGATHTFVTSIQIVKNGTSGLARRTAAISLSPPNRYNPQKFVTIAFFVTTPGIVITLIIGLV
jgi:hypothetical protein